MCVWVGGRWGGGGEVVEGGGWEEGKETIEEKCRQRNGHQI